MTRPLLALFLAVCLGGHAEGFVRMCYVGSWTHQRPVVEARFDIDNIDPSVCTHLLYAFGKVDAASKKIRPVEAGEAVSGGRYSRFNQLKARNPQLRTLLSIGGENAKATVLDLVSKPENVEAFANDAVKSVRQWGFDGLDVDWEFPTDPPSFPRLLQALRKAIDDEASTSGKQKLLLTAALGAGEWLVNQYYKGQVPNIAAPLDLMLIMSYDFAGSWLDKTYFNAPLYSRKNDPRFSPANSQEYVIESVWMKLGAPKEKLVLGMTGAGASFTLSDSNNHGVGAPFTSMAPAGPLYQIGGRLIYPEICRQLSKEGTRVWDEGQAVPYAYWGNTWVGYDDAQSIAAKVSWASSKGLGGVMFWMIDYDDWDNKCFNGTHPLLKAAMKAVGVDPPTAKPGEPAPAKPTGGKPPPPQPHPAKEGFVRMCYVGSWTHQRPVVEARFDIDNIDPSVCTHLLYAFAKVDAASKKIMPVDAQEAASGGRYSRFNQLKARNPQLRTLLSIGGENAKATVLDLVSKAENAEAFANDAVKSLRQWGFDGLDVDWEFPTDPPSFPRLLQALRKAIDDEASTSGKQKLLLTAALGAGEWLVNQHYNRQVPNIAAPLDLMLIMSYDFAGSWLDKTYFNAPLYSRKNDPRFSPANSQEYVIESVWMKLGAPKEKLVLGMTGAGASFTLSDSNNHGVGAPFTSMAPAGPLYQIGGRLIYPEICRQLSKEGTRVWDEGQAVPYAYWGNTWVGYDDAESIAAKVTWASSKGLGGVMFWMIDYDDWDNKCFNGTHPLLKAAMKAAGVDPPIPQPGKPTPAKPVQPIPSQPEKPTPAKPAKPTPAQPTGEKPLPPQPHPAKEGFVRMCYVGSWTHQRPVVEARFDIDNIDPAICTHLLYAFAKVDEVSKKIVPWDGDTEARYSRFNQLKSRNSRLRTLLSVGGQTAGQQAFVAVSRSEDAQAFAKNAVKSLRQWGFDGLDVDWEFPTEPTALPRLLQVLRKAIDDEASTSGKQKLLLTAALGAGEGLVNQHYKGHVPEIAAPLDLMLIMSYDFAGSWLDKTYFNAPLYSRKNDPRFSPANSLEYVIESLWMKEGAPKEKLVLGMTGAGASFTLRDPNNHVVGAPFSSVAPAGPLYQIEGRLMYPEICKQLSQGGTRVWDEGQAVPYAYWGNTWVGYDDAQSIAAKVSWASSKGLGGVMFWMIDYDDWNNKCGKGTHPLLKAAWQAVGGSPPKDTQSTENTKSITSSAILPRPGLLAILVAVATIVRALASL